MALTDLRILITRTRHQASTLAAELEERGAIPIVIPTIEIAPPNSYRALDAALAAIRSYDWLLFTSANAVEAFHRRAQFRHLTAIPKKIAVIGPATARAVEAIGLSVDLIPPQYVAESLAQSLIDQMTKSDATEPVTLLLVRAEEARDYLPEALIASGAYLTIADAYRNQTPPGTIPALRLLFSEPENCPHVITFTSASTATNLFRLLTSANLTLRVDTVLASIGPITSDILRGLGYPPTVEAAEPTIPALIQALETHFT